MDIGFIQVEHLNIEENNLKTWLANGYNGQMSWLGRNLERRCDPCRVMPECKTVIVAAMGYEDMPLKRQFNRSLTGVQYLQHEDYHKVMMEKLEEIVGVIKKEHSSAECKCYVDTGPVLEKAWGARAGLGFIGKNTLLISPEHGSQMALGIILSSVSLTPTTEGRRPTTSCGSCRACIDACPTKALIAPYVLDARKCRSYKFFIEKKEGGCDTCQDVCPYNKCVSA